ncbi:hypothetical protein BD779DRAFT_1789906 [Infundibulicybe gibba]|nr:hypothetical protein BD779DRAFT_1789906 [Infundibulicybe gibba]
MSARLRLAWKPASVVTTSSQNRHTSRRHVLVPTTPIFNEAGTIPVSHDTELPKIQGQARGQLKRQAEDQMIESSGGHIGSRLSAKESAVLNTSHAPVMPICDEAEPEFFGAGIKELGTVNIEKSFAWHLETYVLDLALEWPLAVKPSSGPVAATGAGPRPEEHVGELRNNRLHDRRADRPPHICGDQSIFSCSGKELLGMSEYFVKGFQPLAGETRVIIAKYFSDGSDEC